MKLEKFQKKNFKRKILLISVIAIILLMTGVLLYRTFGFYKDTKELDVIKGQVPDQNYDAMFAFYQEDQNGNKTSITAIPEGKNYDVIVTCTNGTTGIWDYETWGPKLSNLRVSRTKCNITFAPMKPLLIDAIKTLTPITTGTGIYEVNHNEAEIMANLMEEQKNNLKMTEYRYAGKNPNNYVTFNGETAGWRIIGLVNTPEGQRIKLVRASSIGDYSWDSSASGVNNGWGVNEWSQADIMTTLNSGAYYNKTTGTCYNGSRNSTTSCDFSSNGLTSEAKGMIDTITWNTGSQGSASDSNFQTTKMYNYERSNNTGKICSSGTLCTDTVERTTIWKGQIGLMYPSDYGYATSGGTTTNRNTCINTSLYSWDSYSDCYNNNWIYDGSNTWFLTPNAISSSADSAFRLYNPGNVYGTGRVNTIGVISANGVFPTLYLKSSVKAVSGDGTSISPYILST